MRVAVVGVGGVGGALAAGLSTIPAVEVTLCVRSPFDRLTVQRGNMFRDVPAQVATDPAAVAPVDWVVLATKAQDVRAAADWLGAFDDGQAVLAVAQNGIGHAERVAPFWHGDVVPLIVRLAAHRERPGRITVTGDGELTVPDSGAGARFAALCEIAGFNVGVDPDFVTSSWNKLAYNIAGNSLTAILDIPVIALTETPLLRSLVSSVIRECIAVGRAEGVAMDLELPDKAMTLFGSYTRATLSSTHQDLRRGAPIEYHALTGEVVRRARRHGVDVPHNATILALLEALDHRIRNSGSAP